jgi:sirohydrochlorin ferrochelatase
MEGAARCVATGAEHVVMVPYFLSAGNHVTHDLEAARAALQARFTHVNFRLAAPIGRHPLMARIVAERVAEAWPESRAPESPSTPNA